MFPAGIPDPMAKTPKNNSKNWILIKITENSSDKNYAAIIQHFQQSFVSNNAITATISVKMLGKLC